MKRAMGTWITNLRESVNMSQEELADLMGVSRQTVCNWERGVYRPRKDCLQKMYELFGVKESYFYEEPSSLAEEEAAAAVSEAAEAALPAEQVVAQVLPMISPRKRAAFWLMFGLLAFLVVAVSVVLMLAYFPYEQVGDVYTTVVVWNFSYGCIVGMIAAGMLLCLVLLALLAWRFIKKYGFKAKKIQECQAKLDTCQAKLGGQNADDKVQSEEKTR